MKSDKIIILTEDTTSIPTINGPKKVIKELLIQFSKQEEVEFEVIKYGKGAFRKILFLLVNPIKILRDSRSRNLTINVHSESYFLTLYVYILSLIFGNCSFFLTIHGLVVIERRYLNRNFHALVCLEKFIIKRFPNLICVSTMLKNNLNDIFNRNDKVFVVNNGVGLTGNAFSQQELGVNEIRLITTGGVKERKGIFDLVLVLEEINKHFSFDITLDVYGGYSYASELSRFNELISAKDLSRLIIYHGLEYNSETLLNKYLGADLNICLSHYDTFNMAVLESMTVGTPTVVSNQTGSSELIQNSENGFLIDLNLDLVNQFIKVIDFITECPGQFANIRENAFHDVKKYSWKNCSRQYINILTAK